MYLLAHWQIIVRPFIPLNHQPFGNNHRLCQLSSVTFYKLETTLFSSFPDEPILTF